LFDPDRYLLAKSNSTLVTDKVGIVLLPDLSLSPNPVENYLNIKGLKAGVQIEIMDSKGLVHKHWSSNSEIENVDISSLPSGVYMICFSSEEGKTLRKLIHY
jgi:hypothetical protein